MRGRPLTPAQLAWIEDSRRAMVERALRRGGPLRVASYALQSAIVFPLIWLLSALPVDHASALAGWFGRNVVSRLLRGEREKLYRTMRVPFPKMTDLECRALVRDMSDNVMRTFSELGRLGDFAGRDNPRIVLKGLEHLEAAKSEGRAPLFLCGHFANWEVIEVALAGIGLDGVGVVQHPSNPFLVRWLARQRFAHGISEEVGAGTGVYRALRRGLLDGKIVITLCDQRVANGLRVPFFGLETTTNVIPARLARTASVAAIPLAVRRLDGARFEVELHAPLEAGDTGNADADDLAFLTQLHRFFEQEILRRPAHWLWGHPRWDDVLLDVKSKRERRQAG